MNTAVEELYSLLVPLSGERLIVPRACVVEVVRYAEPETEPGAQPWLLGEVSWNGRQLPVVSFEGALGKDVPAATGRTRIVVFYAHTGQLKTGYFGILTQGFPQLVRVNRDVLKFESADAWPEGAPVYCRVRMINEYPLIPNLEKLEGMLAEASVKA
ncbi:MAG: chemotaxis protein CheW [Woeseiaceae bacterium]|nr:chemotaxis protein CheW [Woeseiaceae bacterium]